MSDSSSNSNSKSAVLSELTLKGICSYIQSGRAKNIITMAGAGLSTSAGIPDFRSPGTGLYNKLAKYNLPDPTAIFTLEYFDNDPKPFFTLAKELYPGNIKPTKSHYFLNYLNKNNLLLRHYTQNIDSLERIAGLPDDKIVYAHGNFYTGHCRKCNAQYELTFMKKAVFEDRIPNCTEGECDGVVKPDIVMFGETLPDRFVKCATEDFKKCDLLIIMGTSLTVMPFASLLDRVTSETPRIYINLTFQDESDLEAGVLSKLASLFIGGSSGLRWGKSDNVRDVFIKGDCDSVCEKLLQQLNWKKEFDKLYDSEVDKLNKHLTNKKDLAELCVSGKL